MQTVVHRESRKKYALKVSRMTSCHVTSRRPDMPFGAGGADGERE